MKQKVMVILISSFFLSHLVAQSNWISKARFPGQPVWKPVAKHSGGARGATCGFGLLGMGYVFGGFNGGTEYSELYQYNPVANSWAKKASMPVSGMREPAAFTIDSVAYVGLGFRSGAGSALSHMYRYSPGTNSWTAVASFYQGRRASTGFSIDSLGYIVGGLEIGSLPDNSLYSYSPKTNKWTKKATMPGVGRSYIACGVVNGIAYAMGGYANASATHLKDFYAYDPASNTWDTLANFPGAARGTASSIVIGDVIYFGCGYGGTSYYKDWYGYNTITESWFAASDFPIQNTYGNAFFSINGRGYLSTGAYGSSLTDSTYEFSPGGRGAACGFAVGNHGYVFGGTNLASEFSDLYQFDPGTNTWLNKGNMPINGMREPAAFVIDTLAYVGLGFRGGANSHLSHMYRYSATTNKWTAVAAFYQGRRAAVGFSVDSLGYIFGGYEYGYQPDNSLYAYSPKTNKWTKKATMPGNGRSYTAGVSVNGNAYLMGGLVPGGTVLNEFYMYNPGTNQWTKLTNFPGSARCAASAIVIDSVVYFGGGISGSTHFTDWYGYNTVSKTWKAITDIPTSKTYNNAYFSVGGKGYIATGANNNRFLDSTFELNITVSGVKQYARSSGKIVISSVSGTGSINIQSPLTGALQLEVYDLSGKCVLKNSYRKESAILNVLLPELSTGMYLVVATQQKESTAGKILYNKD